MGLCGGGTESRPRRVLNGRSTISDSLYWALQHSQVQASHRTLRRVVRSLTSLQSASGSCGADPGPVPLRIVAFSASSKKETSAFDVFTFAMLPFTTLTVRGGGTDLILMRPQASNLGKDHWEQQVSSRLEDTCCSRDRYITALWE